jgi:hypothetical protein
MPNDAKLGLVAGVTIVIVVAAVFFRKEPGLSAPRAAASAAVAAPTHSMSRSLKRESVADGTVNGADHMEIP